MKVLRPILFCFCLILLFDVHVPHCELFKYKDESGRLHFTDNLNNIPEKFRKQAEVRKDNQTNKWVYFNTDVDASYYYDPNTITYYGQNYWTVQIKQSFNSDQEYYVINLYYNCITRATRSSTVSKHATIVTKGFYSYGTLSSGTETALLNLLCR